MATIEKRTSKDGKFRYRVLVRLRGSGLQTATFERKTDARRWGQQTEAVIREGRYFNPSEARKHTVGNLVDRYIQSELPKKPRNARNQKLQLEWWSDQLGQYTLANVTPALVVECRDRLAIGKVRGEKTRSPSTVNRYLAVLSHAFSVAMREWGWVDDNPLRKVSKLKEPKGRDRFLSDDERKRLLSACSKSESQFLYPVVVLAISTGMRSSEIMNLRWSDVNLDTGVIQLTLTKNDERRAVPLLGHAHEGLLECSKVRRIDTDLLFPNRAGDGPANIRKAWDKALAEAGIEDFRFHDLRHSAASYLAMNGASPSEIAAVLGHKTLQMVKRYAHLSEQHTASVVASMNEKIFGDG